MDMHQAGSEAEWATQEDANKNTWQRIAARTNGLVTPGNIVSTVGLFLVLYGLVMLVHQQYTYSFLFVGLGRIADIADGMVAHATKTKSPLGEGLDAAIDKIELLAAMAALLIAGTAPFILLFAIVALNFCIAVVSAVARLRGLALHPLRTGKLATFVLWVAFGLYIGHAAFGTVLVQRLAAACLVIAICMSVIALYKYIRQTFFMLPPQDS